MGRGGCRGEGGVNELGDGVAAAVGIIYRPDACGVKRVKQGL